MEKYKQKLEQTKNNIHSSEKLCQSLKKKTDEIKEQEAQIKLIETTKILDRFIEKQKEINIPQRIQALEAEIIVMEKSIEDLLQQKNSIQYGAKLNKKI